MGFQLPWPSDESKSSPFARSSFARGLDVLTKKLRRRCNSRQSLGSYGRKTFYFFITGEVCAWPSGGAVSQGESMGKRPCPALAPQPAIRNPQSAIRIRNPQSVSEIRIVFFFLQGGYRAFLWQGLFAIRKIRTSVNLYRESVIRIMNP
jgi:hypothetical protein